jgi:hypothetical protein
MSHPSVQECMRDAVYATMDQSKATYDQALMLKRRLTEDKATKRIPLKSTVVTKYDTISSTGPTEWTRTADGRLFDIGTSEPTLAQGNRGWDKGPRDRSPPRGSRSSRDRSPLRGSKGSRERSPSWGKGKRYNERSRNVPSKYPRNETSHDWGTNRGKGKASNPPAARSNMPRFRDSFLPLIHRPQAPFQYDLFDPQPLPQENSQFTQEQLTALLGETPTEEDTDRAARIVEAIRNATVNAELFTYEMFDAHKPKDEGYTSIYLNYKGTPVPSDEVIMTHCYRLLPIKDRQKYGNYWPILRLRPGSRYPAVPEYMPNTTYSFEEVSKDFQLAGLPLAHCRYWTEAPLNIYKVAHLYPFYGYLPGNKVSLTKFNRTLRLHRIPYKTELVYYESATDAQGSTRMTARVNIEASMANLLRLRVISNDTKTTLDAYLLKVQESIEKLRKYQLRIPFATGQMVIDAQLSNSPRLALPTVGSSTIPTLHQGTTASRSISLLGKAIPSRQKQGMNRPTWRSDCMQAAALLKTAKTFKESKRRNQPRTKPLSSAIRIA